MGLKGRLGEAGDPFMAVARSEFRNLIGRIDNDNQQDLRPALPASLPKVRPEALELEYESLTTRLEPEAGILWARFRHRQRACFTTGLLADLAHFQAWLRDAFGACLRQEMPFRYLAWGSCAPAVWNLGGDLAGFTRMIRSRDEEGLRAYAYRCVDILHANHRALDLPVMTVALVQGDAIGGGFEAMLTNDLVIAERTARFGLPEILFNLFPGMGAHSLLRRKVGERVARQLIEDGRSRSADEMKELGLVDIVCGKGEGEAVLRHLARERGPRFATDLALKRARHRADPLGRSELIDIVDMWVELALELGEAELRRMDCLARQQERQRAKM
jgi:DSF synthase